MAQVNNSQAYFLSYFCPFSKRFSTAWEFKHRLTTVEKMVAIAAGLFASAVTPFLLGVPGVAVFRLIVKRYAHKKEREKGNIEEDAQEVFKQAQKAQPTPPSQRSKVDFEGYKKFEGMGVEELETHVKDLKGEALADFWDLENQAATAYTEKKELDQMRQRLKIEMSALSVEQLEFSLGLDVFWRLISGLEYSATVGSSLKADHFGCIASWLRKMRLEPPESPLLKTLPKQHKTTSDQYLNTLENYFKKLISAIPGDAEEDKQPLFKKLEAICPHAIPGIEEGLQRKIALVKGENRKKLRTACSTAVKNYTAQKKVLDKLPKPKESPPSSPSKHWGTPLDQQNNSPPLPSLPVLYQRKATDAECRDYLIGWDPLKEVEPIQEDLFFWILDTIGEVDSKRKSFVVHYTHSTKPDEGYKRFEKMAPEQLSAYIKLLDKEALDRFWDLENYAATQYIEKRELACLQRRLEIEIKALSVEQLKDSLPLDVFWRLVSGLEYRKSVGEALNAEQFGTIALWLKELLEQPPESPTLNGFSKQLGLTPEKYQKYLLQLETYFADLINVIPGDSENEKDLLTQKLLAICPHATKGLEAVLNRKSVLSVPAHRATIKNILSNLKKKI